MTVPSRHVLIALAPLCGAAAFGIGFGIAGLDGPERAGTSPLLVLGILAAVAIVALAASVLAARSLGRDIAATQAAIRSMFAGTPAGPEALPRGSEFAGIAGALGELGALTTNRGRISAALEGSPSMMMISDPDEQIVFMSSRLLALLRRLEPVFREANPDFSVEWMYGKHIDCYRTNPRLKRELLSDDGETRKVRYEVGGRTILVDLCYIYDQNRQRIGHTLEWRDVTAELQSQIEVARVVEAARRGDFTSRLTLDDKTGFVRDIAGGLNDVFVTVDTVLNDLSDSVAALAQGDLTRGIDAPYEGLFGEVRDNLNATLARLAEIVSSIKTTTHDVATAAREINEGAGNLSRRTEDQASSLEETAATTEQLAASVKSTAGASRQAVSISQEARTVADTGGSIVNQAVEAMSRIESASQKIADITSVIDDIAFQTNLLALNAAVEAARAGEAGKGFAVVASEVRTLAQRSSVAAKDITDLIQTSTAQVSDGVRLVRSTGDALGRILDASARVSGTVSDIAAASSEQSNGIEEMSQAIAHMDEMTQQNAALAEESAASAASLLQQIERLDQLVAGFRTGEPDVMPVFAPAQPVAALRRIAAEAFPAQKPKRQARASRRQAGSWGDL
ncbi:MAG: methyl-accepting chemotaxis protein [Burkholderiales bacterium]|nr:methyl-accepting chemotaxis protein [Burkholderiales bacterium]